VRYVLIAEDDPAIAQLLEGVLHDRLSADVSVVANGALVPDAIAERRPDLLILDVGLPGLSGVDVFDLVQNSSAYGVPVLFLTADPDRARASAPNAHVIAKPFDVEALVSSARERIAAATPA